MSRGCEPRQIRLHRQGIPLANPVCRASDLRVVQQKPPPAASSRVTGRRPAGQQPANSGMIRGSFSFVERLGAGRRISLRSSNPASASCTASSAAEKSSYRRETAPSTCGGANVRLCMEDDISRDTMRVKRQPLLFSAFLFFVGCSTEKSAPPLPTTETAPAKVTAQLPDSTAAAKVADSVEASDPADIDSLDWRG